MALPFHKLLASIGGGNAGVSAVQKYGASMWLPGLTDYEGNFVASDGSGSLAVANDYIGYARDTAGSIAVNQTTTGFKPQLLDTAGVKSWKFDGVDDRLKAVTMPFGDIASPCFLIGACTVVAGLTVPMGAGGASNERFQFNFIPDNSVSCIARGSTGLGTSITGSPRTLAEKVVVTVQRKGANLVMRVRGNVNAASVQSVAAAYVSYTPVNFYIGSGADAGSALYFSPAAVFGVIAGNGDATNAEIIAMEDFLAARGNFTLV